MGKVTKVEKVPYSGWLYGLEVEEDESFVANGVVVHNCEEGVNPEAKFEVVAKSLDGKRSRLTYKGIPLVKRQANKHRTGEEHRHAPDFESDKATGVDTGQGEAIQTDSTVEEAKSPLEEHLDEQEGQSPPLTIGEKAPEERAPSTSPVSKNSEADLLNYFSAFKSLFNMYHDAGNLDVVLYDHRTGEVLLPDER